MSPKFYGQDIIAPNEKVSLHISGIFRPFYLFIFRYPIRCNGFISLVFLFSWCHVIPRWFYLSSAQEDRTMEGQKREGAKREKEEWKNLQKLELAKQ